MLKRVPAACLAVLLASLLSVGSAAAQASAPIGHRQPSAVDVPSDDSVRGDASLGGVPVATKTSKRDRSRKNRRAPSNVDVILKTPNICSNCNE